MATHGVKTDVGGEPAESTSDSESSGPESSHSGHSSRYGLCGEYGETHCLANGDLWQFANDGSHIVVRHRTPRTAYFVPEEIGSPIDPLALRNERLTVCLPQEPGRAHSLALSDDWTQTGAQELGIGPWLGHTIFVLQGQPLQFWEGGWPEQFSDEEFEEDTSDTPSDSRSRSRSRSKCDGATSGWWWDFMFRRRPGSFWIILDPLSVKDTVKLCGPG